MDGTNLPAGITQPNATPQTLTFDTDGSLDTAGSDDSAGDHASRRAGADPSRSRSTSARGINGITSFAGTSTAVLRDQNGYTAGPLRLLDRSDGHDHRRVLERHQRQSLGQIALADFNNPDGLVRTGDNMYATSGNSGGAVLGYAPRGQRRRIASGALEMSNVDLAQEFTNMIIDAARLPGEQPR